MNKILKQADKLFQISENTRDYEKPYLYQILLQCKPNDNTHNIKTILKKCFDVKEEKANEILTNLTNQKTIICGIYTKEITDTKIYELHEFCKNLDTAYDFIVQKQSNK